MFHRLDPIAIELTKSSLGEPSWFDSVEFQQYFKHTIKELHDHNEWELISVDQFLDFKNLKSSMKSKNSVGKSMMDNFNNIVEESIEMEMLHEHSIETSLND